jgi:hypothetical protein
VDQPDEKSKQEPKRPDLVEVFATLLLALAAVATAWSGYQANRWNGEQVKAGSRTNALRIEAARAQSLSEAETEVDVATFLNWVDAYIADDDRLAQFYETRFRPDFKPAFDAWIATDPFEDPDAPLTPFRLPEYQQLSRDETESLDTAAAASAEEVQQLLQRSANYVLAVVLFAVSLFFAGISTKLHAPRLRVILLVAGWVVFLGTVGWLTTVPVSISV